SGKSPLLRALGVNLLRQRRRIGEVPFLVSLRTLGKVLERFESLAGYLVRGILVDQLGMSEPDASELLRVLLEEERVVLLLDGLDEVASEHYDVVKEAIQSFSEAMNPDCPTAKARLVV